MPNATAQQTRKWTATVSVAGIDVTDLVESSNDTLKDATSAAVATAARMIRDEYGSDASVIVFKQLRGDAEPKRDRSVYVYRDDDGSVKTQNMGA